MSQNSPLLITSIFLKFLTPHLSIFPLPNLALIPAPSPKIRRRGRDEGF